MKQQSLTSGLAGGYTGSSPPKSPHASDEFLYAANRQGSKGSQSSEERKEIGKAVNWNLTQKEMLEAMKSREQIPQIYYPGGKPIDGDQKRSNDTAIKEAYTGKSSLPKAQFEGLTKKLFGFPKFMNSMLFDHLKA